MSDTIVYCAECESVRDTDNIKFCPVCSRDGKPRYIVAYQHGAGVYRVWDRWQTKFLETSEVVEVLNEIKP